MKLQKPTNFGTSIKVALKIKGKTMKDMSEETGINVSSIGRITNGAGCNLDTAFKIADYLGTTVDELRTGDIL